MTSRYSGPQRLGFASLLIGTLMCAVGLGAPYWREGEIKAGDVASLFTDGIGGSIFNAVLGGISLAKFHGGLIFYCVEVPGDSDCEVYEMQGHQALMLLLSSVQILVSILCMLGALCRMCCCSGGKTVCHGVVTFLAGAGGITVVALFATSYAEADSWQHSLASLTMPSLAWAFYIYAAGSGLILIASFMLCFTSPDNMLAQMVMTNAPATTVTVDQQQYSRFDNIQHGGTPAYPPSQQMEPLPAGVANGYGY